MKVNVNDWRVSVFLTVVVLGLLVGAGAAIWHGMEQVGPDAARIWALTATVLLLVLLPATFWAGWRMGRVEAQGRLQGIDDGLDKIAKAADLAINARATHIIKTKEAKADPSPSVVVLPPPVEAGFRMLPEVSDRVEL